MIIKTFCRFLLAFAAMGAFAFGSELETLEAESTASGHGKFELEAGTAAITEADLRRYVERLSSDEYGGRGTGERGEKMATAYLASFFEGLGLKAEGDDGGYYQIFAFDAGKELKGANSLVIDTGREGEEVQKIEPGETYQPTGFSPSGAVESTPVVFAGFGIQADGYDSFEGLDVKGKWILVFRGSPDGKIKLAKFGPLVAKAQLAKKLGAAGIIYAKGTNPAISLELVPPSANVGARGEILPAISVTDRMAASLLTDGEGGEKLKALYENYRDGDKVAGFVLPTTIGAEIGLANRKEEGRNVIARLMVGDQPSEERIVIGAHIDHLGLGKRGSLGGRKAAGEIHHGADDNASGVAAMMELAQYYAEQKRKGTLNIKRDLVFVGWSGEELGLQGSRHFVKLAKGGGDEAMYPATAAYLNLDMVGRLKDKPLLISGTGSSKAWKAVLDGLEGGMNVTRSEGPYLPTDSTSFYTGGVPILALFTGLHEDYHKPSDTVDKIDFKGLGRISNYLRSLTEKVANLEQAPGYVAFARAARPKVVIGIRSEDVPEMMGVRVVDVVEGGPAAKAGIEVGDVIRWLDGKKVNDLQGLLQVLAKMDADKGYGAVLIRDGEQVEVELVPAKR